MVGYNTASSFASGSEDASQQNHLRDTLQQIDQLANDVEMRPPSSDLAVYIVIDTNIVLHHFEVLKTFVDDVERNDLPVIIVVPGAVIYELDGQKNRGRLAWPARRASGWLLEKVRLHKSVKAQATDETCKATKNWRTREPQQYSIPDDMINDHNILDCCQFFDRLRNAVLCSADHNLCIIAQSQGIYTMTPSRSPPWTSRDIARQIYGAEFVDLNRFSNNNAAYKDIGSQGTVGDSDKMLVDDEGSEETPMNVLHDDVRDYFTRLLIELVGKVGGREIREPADASSLSQHAAEWKRKHYSHWTAVDCLEYLYDRKPGLKREMRNPQPERFLMKRYTGRGARPGHEWAAEGWRVGLENLSKVGAAYGNKSIGESVKDLTELLL